MGLLDMSLDLILTRLTFFKVDMLTIFEVSTKS